MENMENVSFDIAIVECFFLQFLTWVLLGSLEYFVFSAVRYQGEKILVKHVLKNEKKETRKLSFD